MFAYIYQLKCNQCRHCDVSIEIRSASSFLLFITKKDLERKYAIETPQDLYVPCEKRLDI